ncbi:MAG: alpha/beta hydrolase [Deltaproteobacteria bacterium]|nr:alpha/beta hydrolase [Deltaproteobacteria bacterium]
MLDRWLHGATKPITDGRSRTPVPGSVAVIEQVVLGGVAQSVVIRGRHRDAPVLLYLHGGPGTSELGMVRTYNMPALEERFLVVVWDQRGAAKSFAAREPAAGMTIAQLVADTCELADLLCRRFGQEKVYLVGHSWGSALGALTAQRRPERFHAFVGVGQVAHMLEGERISYAWTLAQARRAGDSRSIRTLERIGPPPYAEPVRPKVVAQRAVLAKYGGEVHDNRLGGLLIVLSTLLRTREYGLLDRVNFFRGVFASMDLLWPQIMALDLFEQVPRLDVPVLLLEGRHDYEAPSELAARWLDTLVAPEKRLVWFERSAHFINVEEADAFNRCLIDELLGG